jgi:putative transcriptional regulator
MFRATAGILAFAVLCGAAVGPSPDRDPSRLRPGLFLYAAPGITDSRFAESVVLLIQHGPEGSMGLVVNRPTDMPLREAVAAVEEAKSSDLRVHWGGPVKPEAILALVRSPRASPGARTVIAEVHLTGDLADVRAALSGPDPAGRLRVYTGYTGWTAGQLATEVRAGVWVMDRADAASVFAPDPATLWGRVHQLLNRLEVRARRALPGQRLPHARREAYRDRDVRRGRPQRSEARRAERFGSGQGLGHAHLEDDVRRRRGDGRADLRVEEEDRQPRERRHAASHGRRTRPVSGRSRPREVRSSPGAEAAPDDALAT